MVSHAPWDGPQMADPTGSGGVRGTPCLSSDRAGFRRRLTAELMLGGWVSGHPRAPGRCRAPRQPSTEWATSGGGMGGRGRWLAGRCRLFGALEMEDPPVPGLTPRALRSRPTSGLRKGSRVSRLSFSHMDAWSIRHLNSVANGKAGVWHSAGYQSRRSRRVRGGQHQLGFST